MGKFVEKESFNSCSFISKITPVSSRAEYAMCQQYVYLFNNKNSSSGPGKSPMALPVTIALE
jgi:hypothetical protein